MAEHAQPSIGRYRLRRRLGSGAQGTVYLAEDSTLGRTLAIKLLNARWMKQRPGASASVPREARAIARLRHPNINVVLDAGLHEGIPYLVFEHVEGVSAATLIARGDPLAVDQAVALLDETLDGLAHAHSKGVVHGNLRPSNVVISRDGAARIMDFGFAGIAGPDSTAQGMDDSAYRYLSPEHFSGKPLGPASDVYCAARIFLDLVGAPDDVLASGEEAGLDPGLRMVLAGALHDDIESRFADAGVMREALADRSESLAAEPTGATGHATLDFLLRRMQRKSDFPALSRSLIEINRLTAADSNASAKRLANVVLRDYALTNKLLKLANSALYGQVTGGVSHISEAIRMLGFDQVRLAANSLMLMSHLKDGTAVEDLEDAVVASFAAGLIARHQARHAGLADPEEAFVCALFQGLGRTLTIYYFPQEHHEIESLDADQGTGLEDASRAVLGISHGELGAAVGERWSFPESILHCIRGHREGRVAAPSDDADRIRDRAVFANALCREASIGQASERDERLRTLIAHFAPSFTIDEETCRQLLAAALDKLETYSALLGIDRDQNRFVCAVQTFLEDAEAAPANASAA